MRLLILKNLTAHRLRNRMTSIIFSLAIGFIVFLIVSYNLQIKSSTLINLKRQGSYMVLTTPIEGVITPTVFDPILRRNEDKIESFSYITFQLARVKDAEINTLELSDQARINMIDVGVYGVMPGLFASTIDDFLEVDYEQSKRTITGSDLIEQLYTSRGSQGFAIGSYLARQIGAYNENN